MKTSLWRKSVVVAAAGALMFSMAACSSGKDDSAGGSGENSGPKNGPLEIVYLQKQGDQQYFVDEADGAKAAAGKLDDVKVTVVNLGTDSNKAISEVDSAIARGVDGIVIVVPDQAIGPQVLAKAKAAGIPVIASDDGIKDEAGVAAAFVGFDGTQMGNSVGSMAADLYTKAGWSAADTKVLTAGKLDLSVCVQRLDGAKDSFAKAVSDTPEVIQIGTDNSVTNALDKASATVTANSSVKHWVVWGCNDESATGAVTALQNAGVAPENIIGVGLGAYLTCKDWKAGQTTGNKAALYISGYDVGSQALDVMVEHLRSGKALPATSFADTHEVNAENWEAEGVTCT